MKGTFPSRFLPLLLLAGLGLPLCFARVASADSLRGIADFGYAANEGKTRDSSGTTAKTETNSFTQRYRLTLNKTFFPNLAMDAGGLFEKVKADSESEGQATASTATKIRPYFDLRLSTPLYRAAVGYSRKEEERKTSAFTPSTDVNEEYHAILGWKPEGFPDWSVRLEKSDTFDKARVFRDTTTTQVLGNVHYAYGRLDLRYQPSYRNTVNRIDDVETRELTQNGRATYSETFFRKRTILSASYEITRVDTEIIAKGGGEVSFPLFPFGGISILDDTPADGAMDPNPALVDGNLGAGAGLDLGLPPAGSDARPRNAGLDFIIPTETNTLFIWVDRELPPEISGAFSWEIFTSSDNLNWTLAATVFPAPFGPFQNRFEIRFPNVASRYVKAVTRPITIAVPRATEFPDIFVTEVQAFLRRPVAEVRGNTSRTTQTGTADIRTRLLDSPSVYHEISFFLINTDSPSRTRHTLINGLMLNHSFSRMVSVAGRVTREDIEETTQSGVAYSYTASLQAMPLKTLRHSLLFSGRTERTGGESKDGYSMFLRNNAQLYRGIDVNLDGGFSETKSGTGVDTKSTTLNFGVSLVPHKTTTIGVSYGRTTTDRTGGGLPNQTTPDSRGDLSLAWMPFPSLYFFGSVSRIEREGLKETLQNYAVNWSPFQSGALRFNFAFNQDLATRDNAKSRSIRPSLRWNVSRSIILDMSYQYVKTESSVETSDNKSFGTNLQMIF